MRHSLTFQKICFPLVIFPNQQSNCSSHHIRGLCTLNGNQLAPDVPSGCCCFQIFQVLLCDQLLLVQCRQCYMDIIGKSLTLAQNCSTLMECCTFAPGSQALLQVTVESVHKILSYYIEAQGLSKQGSMKLQ